MDAVMVANRYVVHDEQHVHPTKANNIATECLETVAGHKNSSGYKSDIKAAKGEIIHECAFSFEEVKMFVQNILDDAQTCFKKGPSLDEGVVENITKLDSENGSTQSVSPSVSDNNNRQDDSGGENYHSSNDGTLDDSDNISAAVNHEEHFKTNSVAIDDVSMDETKCNVTPANELVSSILKKPAGTSDSYVHMVFDLSAEEAGEKRSVTIDETGMVMIDFPDEYFEFTTADDDAFEEIKLNENEETPKEEEHIPDGGWGWVIAAAAFLLNVILIGTHNVFGFLLLDLAEEFDESLFKTSLIGSIAFGCILVFGPVGGILSNKYGCRKVTLLGIAISVVSLFSSSYVSSVDTMFFTYGVGFGFGTSLSYMQGIVIISRYFSTRRAMATGIVFSGSSIGTLVMAPIYNQLNSHFGWRETLRILSGIIFITFFCGMTYRPLPFTRKEPQTVEERMKRSPARRFVLDLSLWKNKAFVVWAISVGLCKLGYLVPYVHLVKHAEDIGASRDFGSTLMGLIGIASAISRLISGRIADSPRINRLYLSQTSAFLMGLGNIMLPSFRSENGALVYVVLMGLLDGGMEILLPVMTLDLVGPENMTIAWGCLLAVISASAIGPPIAGAMRDVQGDYSGAFYFAGAPMVLSAIVLSLIPLWAQKQRQEPAMSFLSIDPSKLEIGSEESTEQRPGTSQVRSAGANQKISSSSARRFFKLSQQKARSEFTLIWRKFPAMRNNSDRKLLAAEKREVNQGTTSSKLDKKETTE